MIDGLDLVVRQTLIQALPSLNSRIGFQPPDDAWRQRVGAGTGVWLNCALVDLREERHRRSTEIAIERDPLRRSHAPFLMRCHYLLSAWNSAKDSEAVPASMQEHGLLGQVVSALVERALTPAAVLLPSELGALPSSWQETSFDTDLLPPEGFAKIPEFWGTMGRNAPWRPMVWLAVTVPIVPEPKLLDGVVTTLVASLSQGVSATDSGETLIGIGGLVLDATGPNAASPLPVNDALVTLTNIAGRLQGRAITSPDGRFALEGIPPGTYHITARAASHAPLAPLTLTIPAPTTKPLKLRFT